MRLHTLCTLFLLSNGSKSPIAFANETRKQELQRIFSIFDQPLNPFGGTGLSGLSVSPILKATIPVEYAESYPDSFALPAHVLPALQISVPISKVTLSGLIGYLPKSLTETAIGIPLDHMVVSVRGFLELDHVFFENQWKHQVGAGFQNGWSSLDGSVVSFYLDDELRGHTQTFGVQYALYNENWKAFTGLGVYRRLVESSFFNGDLNTEDRVQDRGYGYNVICGLYVWDKLSFGIGMGLVPKRIKAFTIETSYDFSF
ncbi:MAG TPA: hypothetical protein VE954_34955 [Oligoflexus sp.]|uniref:hypothetical protein n=1 Tax=Oligoflexus sp. TaxID=1971216 RepID=UPI002D3E17AA|nr:hypothetical protein [Oligoflexus sp.]HYX38331.1 hypothetical protein [Oligoflexus sp.]